MIARNFHRFGVVGYGCMTCIGNSGPLPEPVTQAIEKVPSTIEQFLIVELKKTIHLKSRNCCQFSPQAVPE